MPVTALVRLKAHKGKGVGLLAALHEPLEATRKHPGCRGARLYMGAESPDELLLVEEWDSAEAQKQQLDELLGSASMEEARELLETAPEATLLSRLEG